MRQWLRRFLAFYRLDLKAVCEQSTGARDYHDYPDGDPPSPMHFYTYRCVRCGKEFSI